MYRKGINMKKKLILLLFMFFAFIGFAKADTVFEVSSAEEYYNKIEEIHNSSNAKFTISLTDDIVIASETVEKNGNTIDNGNTVTILGNGHTYSITVGNKGRFFVSGGTLNLGATDGSDTLIIQGAGDGVAAESSLVTVGNGTANMYKGVTLKDNRSGSYGIDGGAVRLRDDGTFNMYGGVMTNNSVESTGGGGGAVMIDAQRAVFNMYDGEISNNYSVSWGGGILIMSSTGAVNITGGTFKDNQGSYGGAIASIDGPVTISNATFEGNISGYGGALLSYDSEGGTSFIISNSTFKNNTALADGGAICAWGTSVLAENSKIYENAADTGAGVKVYSGEADFSTTSVYNNKATTSGNDFSIESGTTTSISTPEEMHGYAEFESKKLNLVNWYSDASNGRYSLSNPTSIITSDTVAAGGSFELTVSGNEAAVVSFDTDGGDEVEEQVIEIGNKATEPLDPTKYGYRFAGWYTSTAYDTEFDFDAAITEDATVYAKWEELIYDFTDESKNQEITQGDEATFTITGPFSLFGKVYVDDVLIDSSNYTATEGSTIVTLKNEYLSTLSVGTHTLKVAFNDGVVAITTFVIKAKEDTPSTDPETTDDVIVNPAAGGNPNTGDGISKYFCMLILSLLVLILVARSKNRELSKKISLN